MPLTRDPPEFRRLLEAQLRSVLPLPLDAPADLGLHAAPFHGGHRRPQMRRRLPLDPQGFETPMIDPHSDPEGMQMLVVERLPARPNECNFFLPRPQSGLAPVAVRPLNFALLA